MIAVLLHSNPIVRQWHQGILQDILINHQTTSGFGIWYFLHKRLYLPHRQELLLYFRWNTFCMGRYNQVIHGVYACSYCIGADELPRQFLYHSCSIFCGFDYQSHSARGCCIMDKYFIPGILHGICYKFFCEGSIHNLLY